MMGYKDLKSRIIKPHVKDCFMKGQAFEFSGMPVGTFWGNFAAHEGKGAAYYLWIKVSCNDPKCTAIKAVPAHVLAEAPIKSK